MPCFDIKVICHGLISNIMSRATSICVFAAMLGFYICSHLLSYDLFRPFSCTLWFMITTKI
uniref:Uncharacterized protein n=1 Tax=Arundo donax TaxID=35708 RepID=A0A0A9EAD4_ARUDO